ncbi:proton extrusion protein PcxA [Sphaerospermopsis aphanizomenoides BCCUSP55]|uniref:proton extrusion protein PcxA n=1 Tax=Sphaerospermopsis aphanizomenoides TaxID=459663 RepID=UPI001906636E|nr:proton extrusion protein PcxA [Sphaerospermopsis aphanizomenoides]MBK1989542.1 proton extrusion protein PcxA [Sphaerospermopsis aphanizomenoides BCCUSP55]
MKRIFFKRNAKLIHQKITEYWRSFNRWFFTTPERAILEAYQAAQAIRNIEIEQFGGQKICLDSCNYSENVMAFWQGNLNRNLAIIKVRLAEFQLGLSFVNTSDSNYLVKLNFIDEVISKYITQYETISGLRENPIPVIKESSNSSDANLIEVSATQKTGVFPRTIGITINKIAQDFTPKAEEEFIRKYRNSRTRTRRAVKFLLLLMIVPLLTQHFSKELLINPILKHFRNGNTTQIFLNSEMEEKALHELKKFEQGLKFKNLIRQAPELSTEVIEAKVKNKALEIAEEFRSKSNSAISNVFADFISLISFALVIAFSKKDIIFVQSLIDKIVYGLSDSAKAFLIILVTDIFVGFHSPHGWEVLLEGLANHLGLPASRNVIFLFIATFPVILNTIFKYWIFRYLSRLSPSALATLKEMDE